MLLGKSARRTVGLLLAICCLYPVAAEAAVGRRAVSVAQRLEARAAIRSGAEMEHSQRWFDAVEHYEKSLKQWPQSQDIQYGLRRSKTHLRISRRYEDTSFQSNLLRKTPDDALAMFDEVLAEIETHYVALVSSRSFLAHGTESLYFALSNETFLKKNRLSADSPAIARLRQILDNRYWNKPAAHRNMARRIVEEISDLAVSMLHVSETTVVMEYIFGGCNALDNYSSFLTPDRLEDLYGNIEGEFVGLGIEIKGEIGKGLLLINVLPSSPADEGGILPGEHIVAIDRTDCLDMTTDEAARLLRGPAGSRVRLTIQATAGEPVRQRSFVRRPVKVKSIPVARMVDQKEGIAYIQMTGFQKTSATEMDAALRKLRRQGMRALIWDLRGNPGGLLAAAVEVLDRFIDAGVLVSTKGRTQDQNFTYSAHRPGTSSVPMVLLVDDESASASEIVAGAIRDHRRGLIVGRKTYGKWSVQTVFPVHGAAGLRLTTAKFYSPHGLTLGKIGVRPDVVVDAAPKRITYFRNPASLDVKADNDLQKGLELLRRQISRR